MNEEILIDLTKSIIDYDKESFYASCLAEVLLKYTEYYAGDKAQIEKIREGLDLLNTRFPQELKKVKIEFEKILKNKEEQKI